MEARPRSATHTSEVLRRVGWFTAACVLISNVIGSGIFTTTGFMARDLGNPTLILALWLVGAVLALAGAMSYSELGVAFPQAGGEYVYLRHAYGPFLGFLSGWVSFTVGFSAAIAAGAVSFSAYFHQAFSVGQDNGVIGKILALALVWLVTAVHMAGVEAGGFLQRTLTILKIGGIALLIIGAVLIGQGSWTNVSVRAPGPEPGFGPIVVSLIFVIYSYSGWNVAGYLAGEMLDPRRTIPRTMVGGTVFVGLVYLAINLMYFYALPVTILAQEPILPVAEKAAAALFGATAAHVIAGMLCLSIAGAVSAMVWAGPRVYYAMARDGVLPTVLGETAGGGGAPRAAILLQSAWASALVLSGTFEQLVVYSGFVLTIFSGLAAAAVLVLRRRQPDLPRPYRVPLYPAPPILYVSMATVIAIYTLLERPVESVLALATVAAGAPVYVLLRRYLPTAVQGNTD